MAEILAANQITIAKVLDGEQGIPGEPGADGKTSYFHIKYSAVSNPTSSSEMSETPLAYIGTYVDFIEADSTDPTKYTWSRFEGIQGEKGEQGIPGIGQDGRTSYLHIAYATSADGSEGFSISESANKTYIGQYTDFVSTDSTDYTKYAWTKIKGEMSAEQIAQLNQASEDASQAKTDVANLEIGGRNLLKQYIRAGGRCVKIDNLTVKVGTEVADTYFYLRPHCALTAGETYTISCEASNVPDGCNWSFGVRAQGSAWQLCINKNGKIFATGVLDADVDADTDFILDDINGRPSTAPNIILTNFKLEKGNKATDWTPAPEDVDEGIANAQTSADNAQTGVDSLNDTVFGVQTFEYILDGVTIPAHKREDGTYYYILNDEEVTVAEADLVHDANGDLVSYQEGGINESLNDISNNIDAINTEVDGFNAREDALYKSIQDNSLIARKNARVEENSIIITNDTVTEDIASLLNYLQLNTDSIMIYGDGDSIVTIAKVGGNSGYMEMAGTSLLIAQESRLSTIRLRSADNIGNLALVAGSDGHVSLREVLD